MTTADRDRLTRLAGNGRGRGGGLLVPPLLQTVAAELLDHGTRTVADLVRPVESAMPRRGRVTAPDMYPDTGYAGLIADVLEQFKAMGIATVDGDAWSLTKKFKVGKPIKIIPERKDSRGKVINGAASITILPKVERDRGSMEAVEDRELQAMYNDLRADRIFEVSVIGQRKPQQYRLHPLARAIPQMTEDEFLKLAKDIKEHGGVKVPVVLFNGQVLDGRHRLAAASALRVPIRVEEFVGDEDAARDHVVSLNLQRRHLTVAQRTLIVQELFLPQAEAEAKERQLAGVTVEPYGKSATRLQGVAVEIAAARSNGLAAGRTLRLMEPVRHAPKTRERIRLGKIESATQARREALKEIGSTAPATVPTVPRGPFRLLGEAMHKMRQATAEFSVDALGDITLERYLERIKEVEDEIAEHRRVVIERVSNGTP